MAGRYPDPDADIYRAAMRLIERHGDAAEIATILRDDTLIQGDDRVREAVLKAISELRARVSH